MRKKLKAIKLGFPSVQMFQGLFPKHYANVDILKFKGSYRGIFFSINVVFILWVKTSENGYCDIKLSAKSCINEYWKKGILNKREYLGPV